MRYDNSDRESANVIDLRDGREESLAVRLFRDSARMIRQITGSDAPKSAHQKPVLSESEQLHQLSPGENGEKRLPKQDLEIGQRWLDEQLKKSVYPELPLPGEGARRGFPAPEEKDPTSNANEGKLERKNPNAEGPANTNERQPELKPEHNPEQIPDVKPEVIPEVKPESKPEVKTESAPEIEPRVMADRIEKLPDFTPFEVQSNHVQQQQPTQLEMTSPY